MKRYTSAYVAAFISVNTNDDPAKPFTINNLLPRHAKFMTITQALWRSWLVR